MKMKLHTHWLLAMAALLLPACETPEPDADVTVVEAEAPTTDAMNALREAYREAYNAGQMDRVADLYADDGVIISPSAVAEGRDVIRQALQADTAGGQAEINSSGIATAGSLTYDWGTYTITGVPDLPGGEARGDYLAVSRLVNGAARLVALMTGQPQEPPAADAGGAVGADSLRDAFVEAYNAGDMATVASFFAEDAIFVNSTGVHPGRPAIQQGLIGSGADSPRLSVTPLGDTDVDGASWGWGRYRVTNVPDAPGGEVSGYFLTVTGNVGGEEKIVAHMTGSPRQMQQMQQMMQQQ